MTNDNFTNKEMFGAIADKVLLSLENKRVKKIYQNPQPQAEPPTTTQLLKVILSYNEIIKNMEKTRKNRCENCKDRYNLG